MQSTFSKKVRFPEEKEIPADFCLKTELHQNFYLVNGELRQWKGEMREVFSPVFIDGPRGIRQKKMGEYPLMTEKESLEALESAKNAYFDGRGVWPQMTVHGRIRHIELFTERMIRKKREIVLLLMWEIGKSYTESEQEFDRTVDYIRNTIHALRQLGNISSKVLVEQGVLGLIRRAPLGVVLCMGPFNYPLNETFTTLIPALIMGNAVIFKPPKLGVLLHNPVLEDLQMSFPPGVVNTVYGEGKKVITPMLATGNVDVLAFIGSSKVADTLKRQHSKPHRLRSVLGLEAKNPAIVLPDADMDITVKECLKGSLAFNGQRCTALKILFVHVKVVDDFLEKFRKSMEYIRCGMPWEENVVITPLPEPNKTAYLAELLQDALSKGAKVINEHGGEVCETLMYPALVYPVNENMRIYTEEQFGPIVPVVPYESVEDPVQYLIQSSYGQQASIFGRDVDTLGKLLDILANHVCRVNINSMCQRGPDIFPFAGRKDSGEGTLSVTDALRVFSIRTIIAAGDTPDNKQLMKEIVAGHKSSFLSSASDL
jgi:glyceraldehyde-3-phosphate dehydrogenase (NADP+)